MKWHEVIIAEDPHHQEAYSYPKSGLVLRVRLGEDGIYRRSLKGAHLQRGTSPILARSLDEAKLKTEEWYRNEV